MNILEFSHASLSYKKHSSLVLRDINLTFESSKMVAIIGSSGAGKSSLFKSLARILTIQNGQITYNNKSIDSMSFLAFKKFILKVGFLHQKPNLVPTETVFTNLKRDYYFEKNRILNYFKFISPKLLDKFYDTLKELKIENYLFHQIKDLSGGEQQRVEICKLLLKNPEIILADEPTSSLDQKTSQLTLKLLKDTTLKLKTITLVNIHSLDLLMPQYFDYVVAIKDCQILFFKPIEQLEKKEIAKVYE